jgi:hypothetical protein
MKSATDKDADEDEEKGSKKLRPISIHAQESREEKFQLFVL